MSEHIFKLPDLGEGTVESEIGEWFIKVGDEVKEEDVVGTMMTDKAAVELSSPVSGRVIRLAGEPGDIVAVGAPLVVFETEAGAAPAPAEAKPAPQAAPAAEPPVANRAAAKQPATTRVITSPAIRRRAKEMAVDLSHIEGSGPGGRITRADFDAYANGGSPSAQGGRRRKDTVREIKVIGLRRVIAERMAEATREIPHFSYVEELDITELEALRQHLNRQNPEQRLTLLPFLGVALVRVLREFPQCNATYDKARKLLLQHDAVHLGVATQTPDGLKVPVVRHAETMSLRTLAAEIRRVADAARDNSAKKSELSGSTITITSLGKLGGIASTPVINLPEVGIVGVNRAVERPVVHNGQIAVRLMMNLSSSFDHRFVDGYDAAQMIQRVRELFEHPATLFID
ncbi:MAG: dihydrolipoamide acetyltransferase family protein [Pseudomonadota bacterium]